MAELYALYQILSESAKICRRYDKNVLLFIRHGIGLVTKHDFQVSQVSAAKNITTLCWHFGKCPQDVNTNNYEYRSIIDRVI